MPTPLVLVDALNVLRSRWPNIPHAKLVDLAQAWAVREGVEALIVFDGDAPSGHAGPTVVGTGSATADDWIVEHAPELAADRPVWLVTSDRELRRRAAAHVERTIGGGSFAGQLVALDRALG